MWKSHGSHVGRVWGMCRVLRQAKDGEALYVDTGRNIHLYSTEIETRKECLSGEIHYIVTVVPKRKRKLRDVRKIMKQRTKTLRKGYWETGEMAQRLSALAVLPEVLGSIPSTHMVAHTVKL